MAAQHILWNNASCRLDGLERLKQDWDGEGGLPPSLCALNQARSLLLYYKELDFSNPIIDVYLMSGGEITLEWHLADKIIKRIEIDQLGGCVEMVSYPDKPAEFRRVLR